jgi:ribosome-associated protein
VDVLTLAQLAAQAAADKKASRIVLQDLRGQSDLCQYQLICSGSNEKQTQAICQGIEDHLRRAGVRAMAIEGKQTGQWILVDFGSVIVHIFYNLVRDHYNLEELFPGAKPVEVIPPPASAVPPA